MAAPLNIADLLFSMHLDTSGIEKGEKKAKKSLDRLQSESKQTDKAVKKTESGLRSMGRAMAAVAGGALAAQGIVSMFRSFNGVMNESIAKFAKIESLAFTQTAIIRSMGRSMEFNAAGLKAQADALDLATLGSAAKIQEVQNKLLTFGQIGGDLFTKLVETAQDFEAVGFGDATQSIVQLGKAFNEPLVGLTALTRVGVSFDAQQKARIKQYVAENKLLEAQMVMYEAINAQVGGAARAQASGVAGQLDTLDFWTNKVKENFGKVVTQSDFFQSAIEKMVGAAEWAAQKLGKIAGDEMGIDQKIAEAEKALADARAAYNEALKKGRTASMEMTELQGLDASMLGQGAGAAPYEAESKAVLAAKRALKELREEKERLNNLEVSVPYQAVIAERLVAFGKESLAIRNVKEAYEEYYNSRSLQNFREEKIIRDAAQTPEALMGGDVFRYQKAFGDMEKYSEKIIEAQEKENQARVDAAARVKNFSIALFNATHSILEANELVKIKALDSVAGADIMSDAVARQGRAEVAKPSIFDIARERHAANELRKKAQAAQDAEAAKFTGMGPTPEEAEVTLAQNRVNEILKKQREEAAAEAKRIADEAERANEERRRREEEAERQSLERRNAWFEAFGLERLTLFEQNAENQMQINEQVVQQQIQGGIQTFNAMMANSKKGAEAAKKIAMFTATINGIAAAIAAWKWGMETGGPVLAAVTTAASVAVTTAQLAQINSQKFGGSRRRGGPVSDEMLYEVGHGPEILEHRNKQYLIGAQGTITPAGTEKAGSMGGSTRVDIKVEAPEGSRVTGTSDDRDVIVNLVRSTLVHDLSLGGNPVSDAVVARSRVGG